MIHQGLGGGSSSPRPTTGWQNLHQNLASISGNPVGGQFGGWNPTTSYDSVDQWRLETGSGTIDLPGLGGGFPEGWQWKQPVTAPGPSGSDWGSMMWLFLGLM